MTICVIHLETAVVSVDTRTTGLWGLSDHGGIGSWGSVIRNIQGHRALRRGTSGNIDGHGLSVLQLRGASRGQADAPLSLS